MKRGNMMTYWTEEELKEKYTIKNAIIKNVDLSMADHGCLSLSMSLEGEGWGVVYGGYCIGKGYLGANEFTGYEKGIEYIMRIMDVVGVERFNDMKGKYIRVATLSWGDPVKIIGNIIEDKWFDSDMFFSKEDED